MEDPLPPIVFISAILLLRGFLVLTETAFISSRKTRLKARAEGGNKKYRRVLEALEQRMLFVGALRIGIIFLGILAGVAGGLSIAQVLDRWAEFFFGIDPMYLAGIIGTAGITAAAVLVGDVIPKQIALIDPERIALGTLPILRLLTGVCKPILIVSIGLSRLLLRAFRIDPDASEGMTEDELRIALMEGEKSGIVESEERTMVEGVFYLGDRPVGSFMSHRSEIVCLDLNETPETIRSTAIEHRNQRYFPVADGNLDEIAGVVSVQDILIACLNGPWRGMKSVMKPPFCVPETMSALKAFEAFKKGGADFLLVMDEYGGFAGVLSIGSLIEEIVGQLSASARKETGIIKQEDGAYLVDGNVNIDEAAETLGMANLLGEHLPYRTVAGFILSLTGEIPRTGESFEYGGYRFQVVDMDGNRIDKILIQPLEFR